MPKSPKGFSIFFHFQEAGKLTQRLQLKQFLEALFKKEKTSLGELRFIFCSDAYLLKMNKKWLGHDYYTDILSFNLSGAGMPVNGEIYITLDRVKDNAVLYGVSFKNELERVIFHGSLHLCGYDDSNQKRQSLMRQKENYYLTLYRKK